MNLNKLAAQFHTADFIKDDPVQFPHLYKEKTDIEISAFVSAWIAYGSRVQIIKTLNKIHQDFLESPTNYIKEKKYQHYQNQEQCLYRFYQEKDFFQLCETLHKILFEENFTCLEEKIQTLVSKKPTAIEVLEAITKTFPNQKGTYSNDKNDPHWCLEYMGGGHYFDTAQQLMDYYASRKFKKPFGPSL